MEAGNLFSDQTPDNERAKVAGMARALESAPVSWKEMAELWVLSADRGRQFTSEDIVADIGLPTGDVAQNRNSAVGAFLSRMARVGWIRDTGRWVKSKRRELHAAKITVWEVT
mgnify:CR=1 FL=1